MQKPKSPQPGLKSPPPSLHSLNKKSLCLEIDIIFTFFLPFGCIFFLEGFYEAVKDRYLCEPVFTTLLQYSGLEIGVLQIKK